MDREQNDSRLTEVEIFLMHQQNVIEQLNEVVMEQQRTIDTLLKEVQAIKDQLKALDPSINRLPSEEEPPPHY